VVKVLTIKVMMNPPSRAPSGISRLVRRRAVCGWRCAGKKIFNLKYGDEKSVGRDAFFVEGVRGRWGEGEIRL